MKWSQVFIIASLTRVFFLPPLFAQEVSPLESHLEKFQIQRSQKERFYNLDEALKLIKTQEDIHLLKNYMLLSLEKEEEDVYILRVSLLKISKEIYGKSFIIDLLYERDTYLCTFTTQYNRLNRVLGVISELQIEYALPHLHSLLRHILENSLEFQSHYFKDSIFTKTLEAIGKINHSESVFYIIRNYKNKPAQWARALMHFAYWQRPYFPGKRIIELKPEEIKHILELTLSEKMLGQQHDNFFIASLFLMRFSDNLPHNLLQTYMSMAGEKISQKRTQFIQEFLERFDTIPRLIIAGSHFDNADSSYSHQEININLFQLFIPILLFVGHRSSGIPFKKKEEILTDNILSSWYNDWTYKIRF
ncbi:MAG: hypothetical protein HYW47_00720 [Deltaproteobacteria bacterium]|nr:hypothetical protein [Deltaproteobacteria bacterium]